MFDGSETFEIRGLEDGQEPNDELTVVAEDDGNTTEFDVTAQVVTIGDGTR